MIYEVCPEGIQTCNMKIETFIEEDTRNIVHRTMTQSPSKKAPWDLTQFSQSPLAAPSYFPESHWQCEIPFLSKVILVWGKARSVRAPNLGCRGAESPEWFDFAKKNCMRRDTWVDALSWWSCQSPVAHSCSLLNHLVEECPSLMQNLMHIHYSTLSFSIWRPHSTCAHSTVSIQPPHWLAEQSRHCSHMHIPVYCPWLSGYINVMQTVLIILAMAGLFPDRCHTLFLIQMPSQYLKTNNTKYIHPCFSTKVTF